MEDRTPGRRSSDWQRVIEEAVDASLPADLVVKEPETALEAMLLCRQRWSEIHMQMSLDVHV